MPRLATTGRPPLLASLCLLGAVVTLGPAPAKRFPEPEPMGPRPAVTVAGIPRGDLYDPPAIDPWILQSPRTTTVPMPNAWHMHDLVWRPAPARLDDLVSGFLRLLAGSWT